MKRGMLSQGLMSLNLINTRSLWLLIAMFTLTACGSHNEAPDVSSLGDNVSFKIPDSILASRLDQTAGTLSATISVNGGTPQAMTLSATNASVTLSSIPVGDTSFTIVFTYELPPNGPLVVASATKSMTIVEGSNSINFAASDFDTASFDADGDGLSNLQELDETSTTSPLVALCNLGTAVLGSCELGS